MTRILLAALAVIIVIGAGTAWFVTRIPASPFDAASAAAPAAALVQRGEYVARLGDCVACHSTPTSAPFAGGLEMATPMGSVFATNITPDKETGIGAYTLAEFDRAVRRGVARDGHRLYPAMPYPSYAKLTDDDVTALYAFFLAGVQPVRQENRMSGIPWPLNMRWPLALWNAAFTQDGSFQPDPARDAQWNRGAYLIEGLGHCGACHTPRGLAFNEKGLTANDAAFLAGAPLDGWFAPSLRQDADTGLRRWSEEDITQFLKAGRNRHGVVFGSMSEAFNNSTQYMSDADLAAIAHVVKSLPGSPGRGGEPWHYDGSSNSALTLANRVSMPGAQLFAARCSYCHGMDGRGQNQWVPPLAGATSSLSAVTDSSVNVTLNGSARVVAAGVPDTYRMPPFRQQLSDREIADVLTFVRSSWGNKAVAVRPDDVKALRDRTNPASSNVIVLQMR